MAERRQIRWELADSPQPQGSLFEESIFEREPGRGEFRGMEFLHVKARTIINELKGGAPFGFQYTINPYRGCSHACSYCMSGDTPILLADGRTKPMADLRVGDDIYGTEAHGDARSLVPTKILDTWSTRKPACRVLLANGTELIASADHRFLSARGWQHVSDLHAGSGLVGIGRFVAGPPEDDDYRRGYLCGLIQMQGDLDDFVARPFPLNRRFEGQAVDRAKLYLYTFGISSIAWPFRDLIQSLIEWPATASDSWGRGLLAGVFDAAGRRPRGHIRLHDLHGPLAAHVHEWMGKLGFDRTVSRPDDRVRFFHTIDPAVTWKRSIDDTPVTARPDLRVVSVEPLGMEQRLYDITTGTGDFVANGVISHNCFARPTHTYLDLDADRDFERSIVVKVNAVERLRHELDPRRWAGEHIAMGTNTDPYQRCEGKYRLTRGIVETLAEHRNPFSILTKSTLILRDLDVLAEAAKHTPVRVNFSIGTLDEAVWHTTEPGTPHPLRRVRAVQQLNEAGVECGVLVAPILPGLSDGPEQLEAVVRACVEAGAVSISTVLLHLRPGVKEVFMSRLAETHPHLVDDYRRRYGSRSYASKTDQQTVAATVRGLVRRFGGLPAARLDVRHHAGHDAPAPSTEPTAAPAIQLELM